jgi:hypothetical protein
VWKVTSKPRSSWNNLKNNMKNMPIKHKGVWSSRLGNTCE